MPTRKSRRYNDPKFNDWLFEKLSNLTDEEKMKLSAADLYRFRDKTALRTYCSYAGYESIEVLLTKIGYHSFRGFYKKKSWNAKIIKDAYKQVQSDKLRLDVIKEMMEQDIFVIDSFVVAQSLALMSANCHGELFQINSEFLKIKTAAIDVKRHFISLSENRNQVESLEGFRFILKLLFGAMQTETYMAGKENIQMIEVAILILTGYFAPRYVSLAFLKRKLKPMYSEASIAIKATKMFTEKDLLDKMPTVNRDPSYKITHKGFLVLGDLANRILNQQME